MAFRYMALVLVAVNILIFGIQVSVNGFTEDFLLQSSDITERPWILVTSMFLHGSLSHLLGNMFALGLFGTILENIIGTKRFLIIYFSGGVIASLVSAPFYNAALGASGAIFVALGTLAAIRPRMMIWVYGVPMPMFVAAGFWLLIDLAGAFFPSNIANIAHIAGLIFGIAVGIFMRKQFAERRVQKKRVLKEKELDQWEDEWM